MSSRNITILLIAVSIVALVVETTIINFPLIFFLGAMLLVLTKRVRLYVLIFIIAFIIDSLRVSYFGLTPLFLLATIALILFYERYSGSSDYVVSAIMIATTGFIYAHFMSYSLMLTLGFYGLVSVGFYIYSMLKSRGKIFI